MKEIITLQGDILDQEQYCEVVKALINKGYEPTIDPRQFDSPLSIKARFKVSEPNVRFVEFGHNLEVSMEHDLTRARAKAHLRKIQKDLEELLKVGDVRIEDYEIATLQMISRDKAVITAKNDAEKKLFQRLEEKKIFTSALSLRCPKCDQAFMIPSKRVNAVSEKTFCVDCNSWFFPKQSEGETYIINEEYMEVMDSVWGKVQKLIKSSWREVTKRGIPMVKTQDGN